MPEPYDPPAPLSEPRPTDSSPIDPALLDPARDPRPFPWGTAALVLVLLFTGVGLVALMDAAPRNPTQPAAEKTPAERLAEVRAAGEKALDRYEKLDPAKGPNESRWRIPIAEAMAKWAQERERAERSAKP
jgi:hypothetical protein